MKRLNPQIQTKRLIALAVVTLMTLTVWPLLTSPPGSVVQAIEEDIVVDGNERIQGDTEYQYLSGSIHVTNGGKLTIRNTVFMIQQDIDHPRSIIVEDGGELIIENSIITIDNSAVDPFYALNVSVENGKFSILDDSRLQFPGVMTIMDNSEFMMVDSTIENHQDLLFPFVPTHLLPIYTDAYNDAPVFEAYDSDLYFANAVMENTFEFNSISGLEYSEDIVISNSTVNAIDTFFDVDFRSYDILSFPNDAGLKNTLRLRDSTIADFYNVQVDEEETWNLDTESSDKRDPAVIMGISMDSTEATMKGTPDTTMNMVSDLGDVDGIYYDVGIFDVMALENFDSGIEYPLTNTDIMMSIAYKTDEGFNAGGELMYTLTDYASRQGTGIIFSNSPTLTVVQLDLRSLGVETRSDLQDLKLYYDNDASPVLDTGMLDSSYDSLLLAGDVDLAGDYSGTNILYFDGGMNPAENENVPLAWDSSDVSMMEPNLMFLDDAGKDNDLFDGDGGSGGPDYSGEVIIRDNGDGIISNGPLDSGDDVLLFAGSCDITDLNADADLMYYNSNMPGETAGFEMSVDDPTDDDIFFDLDGDGQFTGMPDFFIDGDGAATNGRGSQRSDVANTDTLTSFGAGQDIVGYVDSNANTDFDSGEAVVWDSAGDGGAGDNTYDEESDWILYGNPADDAAVIYFDDTTPIVFDDSFTGSNGLYDNGEDLYWECGGNGNTYSPESDPLLYIGASQEVDCGDVGSAFTGAELVKFIDADHDGSYDPWEIMIKDTADDDILDDGDEIVEMNNETANYTLDWHPLFTDVHFLNDADPSDLVGNPDNTGHDGEAIWHDGNGNDILDVGTLDGSGTDTLLIAGICDLVNFADTDNIFWHDSDSSTDWNPNEDIWFDVDGDAQFDPKDTLIYTGSDDQQAVAGTTAGVELGTAGTKTAAYIDSDHSGDFQLQEPIIDLGGLTITDGDPLVDAYSVLDNVRQMWDDGSVDGVPDFIVLDGGNDAYDLSDTLLYTGDVDPSMYMSVGDSLETFSRSDMLYYIDSSHNGAYNIWEPLVQASTVRDDGDSLINSDIILEPNPDLRQFWASDLNAFPSNIKYVDSDRDQMFDAETLGLPYTGETIFQDAGNVGLLDAGKLDGTAPACPDTLLVAGDARLRQDISGSKIKYFDDGATPNQWDEGEDIIFDLGGVGGTVFGQYDSTGDTILYNGGTTTVANTDALESFDIADAVWFMDVNENNYYTMDEPLVMSADGMLDKDDVVLTPLAVAAWDINFENMKENAVFFDGSAGINGAFDGDDDLPGGYYTGEAILTDAMSPRLRIESIDIGLGDPSQLNFYRWVNVFVHDQAGTPVSNVNVTVVDYFTQAPVDDPSNPDDGPTDTILEYLERTGDNYNLTDSQGTVRVPVLTDVLLYGNVNGLYVGNYRVNISKDQSFAQRNASFPIFPVITESDNIVNFTVEFPRFIPPDRNPYFGSTPDDLVISGDDQVNLTFNPTSVNPGSLDTNYYTQQGKILIEDEGTLNLFNVTLWMQQDADSHYYIRVTDTGSLVMDRTTLDSDEPIYVYLEDSASLHVSDMSALNKLILTCSGSPTIIVDGSALEGESLTFTGTTSFADSTLGCTIDFMGGTSMIDNCVLDTGDGSPVTFDSVALECQDTTFAEQVVFSGASDADLTSVEAVDIEVYDTSVVRVNFWVSVQVLDEGGNPLPGATVNMYKVKFGTIDDASKVSDITDEMGQSLFRALSYTITKDGYYYSNNYYFDAEISGKTSIRETGVMGDADIVLTIPGSPDLKFNQTEIPLPEQILLGDEITIPVTVENTGDFVANDVDVILIVNGEEEDKMEIGDIDSGSTVDLDLTWIVESMDTTLEIIVDPDDVVGELDEDNNKLIAMPDVSERPLISILSFDVSDDNPTIGETITFDIQVQNSGGMDILNPVIVILTAEKDDDVTELVNESQIMAAGDTLLLSTDWETDELGTFTLSLMANTQNNQADPAESVLSVTIKNHADLFVNLTRGIELSVAKVPTDTPAINQTVDIGVTVDNKGETDARGVTALLFVDMDPYFNGTDLGGLSESDAQGVITFDVDAKESATLTFQWEETVPGFHTFYVVIDPWDMVTEINENNNNRSRSVWFTRGPDLVFDDDQMMMHPDNVITSGDDLTVNYTIRNIGEEDTRKPLVVSLYINSVVPENQVAQSEPIDMVKINEAFSGHLEWTPDFELIGYFDLIMVVDSQDRISEYSEFNNELWGNLTILTRPNLVLLNDWTVSNDFDNSTPDEDTGYDVTVRVRVTNTGQTTTDMANVTVGSITRTMDDRMQSLDKYTLLDWEMVSVMPGEIREVELGWYSHVRGEINLTFSLVDEGPYTEGVTSTISGKKIYLDTRPDLNVTSVKAGQPSVTYRRSVGVTVNIRNLGDLPINGDVLINVSYSLMGEDSWVLMDDIENRWTQGISSGEAIEFNFEWTAGSDPGDFQFLVEVDPTDWIMEEDETNNLGELVIKVLDKAPDLAVTDFEANITTGTNFTLDEEGTFNFSIINTGNAPAQEPFNYVILLKNLTTGEVVDTIMSGQISTPLTVPDMDGNVVNMTIKWTPEQVGSFMVEIFVNDEEIDPWIMESSWEDNSYEFTVNVTQREEGVDLNLRIVTDPATYGKGDAVNVAVYITNEGESPVPAGEVITGEVDITQGGDSVFSKPFTYDRGIGAHGSADSTAIISLGSFTLESDEQFMAEWTVDDAQGWFDEDGGTDVFQPQESESDESSSMMMILIIVIVIVVVVVVLLLVMKKRKGEEESATCQECGAEVPADATECPECGAEFPTEVECAECGSAIPAGADVCPECGAPFTPTGPELPAPPEVKEKPRRESRKDKGKKGKKGKGKEDAGDASPEELEDLGDMEELDAMEEMEPEEEMEEEDDFMMEEGDDMAEAGADEEMAECFNCGAMIPLSAPSCPQCGMEFE